MLIEPRREAHMKKSLYLAAAAALLMATTSAHAGNGFSFEIGEIGRASCRERV